MGAPGRFRAFMTDERRRSGISYLGLSGGAPLEFLLRLVPRGHAPKCRDQPLDVLAASGAAGHVSDDPGEQAFRFIAAQHRLDVLLDDGEPGLATFVALTAAEQPILQILVHFDSRCPAVRSASRTS